MVVDRLAERWGAPGYREKWKSETTRGSFGDVDVVLVKPQTYMNLSGKSVRYWVQKKKIQPANLLVVVDDLNLPFEKIRLKGKGSHGGHNGLKDIHQTLMHIQVFSWYLMIYRYYHKRNYIILNFE